MHPKYDAIIIGGGHNGLVSAAYLGKAGKRVLVLERRHVLGGAAVTEEIFPGFRLVFYNGHTQCHISHAHANDNCDTNHHSYHSAY